MVRTSFGFFSTRSIPRGALVLLTIIALGGPARAVGERAPGLVYGNGFTFLVSPPPGWVLDNRSGVGQGLYAVFYPHGQTWEKASAVMYVNSAERKAGMTLEGYIAKETGEFNRQVGGRVRVRALPSLAISSGAKVPVRTFSGDRWGNHEAVAYVESPGAFIVLALTARKQADFEAALPAFRTLVSSWRFVSRGKEEVFAAALATARSNEETLDGSRYDADFGRQFGRIAGVMRRCTQGLPQSEMAPFDLVARIGAEGEVEDALVRPETEVARCLCAEVRKNRFSSPPEPGWWVQVHMVIGP